MAIIEELRTSVPLLGIAVHEKDIYAQKVWERGEISPHSSVGDLPYTYINYIKKNFQRLEHIDSSIQFDVLKLTFADPEFIFVRKAGESPVRMPKETLRTDINGISYTRKRDIKATQDFLQANRFTSVHDPDYKEDLLKDQMDSIYKSAIKYRKGIWYDKNNVMYPSYSSRYLPQGYSVIILPIEYVGIDDKYEKYYYGTKYGGGAGFNGVLCITKEWSSRAQHFILSYEGILYPNSPEGRLWAATSKVMYGNPVTDGANIILGEIKAETEHTFKMELHKKKKVFGINIQWMRRGSIWSIGYGNNAYNVYAPMTTLGQKINYQSQKFSGIVSDIDIKFPETGSPEVTIIFTELLYLFRDVNMSRYRKYQWGIKRPAYKGIDVYTIDGKGKGVGKDKKGTLSYFDRNKERLKKLKIQGKSDADILNKTLDIIFINMNFIEIIKKVCTIYGVKFEDEEGKLNNQLIDFYGVPIISYREQAKINMFREHPTKKEIIIDKKKYTKTDIAVRDELLLADGELNSKDYYESDLGKKAIKNADSYTRKDSVWLQATLEQRSIMNKVNNAKNREDEILVKTMDFRRIEFAIWKGNQSAWDFLTQLILKPLNLQLIHVGTKVTLKHEVDPEGIALVGKYLNLLDQLVTIKQKIATIETGGIWKDLMVALKTKTDIQKLRELQAGQTIKYGTWGEIMVEKGRLFLNKRKLTEKEEGNKKKWEDFSKDVEVLINEIEAATISVDDMATVKLARTLKYDPANADKYESHVTIKKMEINKANLSRDYDTISDDVNKTSQVKNLNELMAKVNRNINMFGNNTEELTEKEKEIKQLILEKFPGASPTPLLGAPSWEDAYHTKGAL